MTSEVGGGGDGIMALSSGAHSAPPPARVTSSSSQSTRQRVSQSAGTVPPSERYRHMDPEVLQQRITQYRNGIYPLAPFWDKLDAEINVMHNMSMQYQNTPSQSLDTSKFGGTGGGASASATPRGGGGEHQAKSAALGRRPTSEHYKRAWSDVYASRQKSRDERAPRQRGKSISRNSSSVNFSRTTTASPVKPTTTTEQQASTVENINDDDDDVIEATTTTTPFEISVTIDNKLRLKARRAWGVIRRWVFEKRYVNKSRKQSQFRWKAVQHHITNIAQSTDTRLQLYDRYLENADFWIHGFTTLPESFALRYRAVLNEHVASYSTTAARPVSRMSGVNAAAREQQQQHGRQSRTHVHSSLANIGGDGGGGGDLTSRPPWISYFNSKPAKIVRSKTHCV